MAHAVIASISTPVFPSQRTIERTSMVPLAGSRSNVTSTESMVMLWESGMRLGVCFAASTPATLAVVRTSPFGSARSTSFCNVAGCMRTVATATASRTVARFRPTSTIEIPPVSSKCEKSLLLIPTPHLFELFDRIDAAPHLAADPEPLGRGGKRLQIVLPRRDLRVDLRQDFQRVAGAEDLRDAVPDGDEHRSLKSRPQLRQRGRSQQRIVDRQDKTPRLRVPE